MRKTLILLVLFNSIKIFSQNSSVINLSKINFCELSIDDLKREYPDLKEVILEEMDLCSDGFRQDGRFENKIGYESKLFPGVIFQKYRPDNNAVAKIHLTKEFKGFLPDGNYIEVKTLKASDILKKYDSLNSWTSRGCSDYLGIKKNDQLYFYVKINKSKKPQYPIDDKYYSDQFIEGIDIISDCYSYYENTKNRPLYIVDGKEETEEIISDLKPEDVDSITVLKDKSAIEKYGQKGKDGVIEIFLKKKK
ncbi:hypothetical protein [Flavobacterium sp. XS2P39]|uniref:hypothetical protein n=1 Tax=Flavobacterium sp. XS2P39 TaxID=3401725 RepID=UPI003AAC9F78